MDVRFCEGRNHSREAQVRAADADECARARSSEARVRRTLFLLDKDLHGCRQAGVIVGIGPPGITSELRVIRR